MYLVSLSHSAAASLRSLPPDAQRECKKLVDDLKKVGNRLGKPLGNKYGMDLTGCYKIYFFERQYRIVYTMLTAEEVYILAIGKRQDLQAYVEAYKNMKQ
jgi:mRNA-degrading endonuclease RelE of RelBE toxin-antitoxin system